VFHSRSAFDGTALLSADSSDDNALARDIQPLLPGQRASSANLTSHTRGINGLMVDLANLAYGVTLTAADFIFRSGTGGDPATWALAPAPSFVSTRRGAGAGGSDRVTIGWSDNTIRNRWLQVTVRPSARTGLAAPDVFYFGSLVGETGPVRPGATAATINAQDLGQIRAHISTNFVTANNRYDFNHDGKVTARDLLTARAALGQSLALFTAPAAAAVAAGHGAFSVVPVSNAIRTAPTRRTTLELTTKPDVLPG
jgi:hypothetical protein